MGAAKSYVFIKDYTGTWKSLNPPFAENKVVFKSGDIITASNNITNSADILYTSPTGKEVEVGAVGMPLVAIPLSYVKEGSVVKDDVITAGKFRLLNDFVLEKVVNNCIKAPCPSLDIIIKKGDVIEGTPISAFDFHTKYTKDAQSMKFTAASKIVSGILYMKDSKAYMIPLSDVEKFEPTSKEKNLSEIKNFTATDYLKLAFIFGALAACIYGLNKLVKSH